MAAATDKRAGDPCLTGIGRNIFRSNHRCLSPMAQLRISPHSSLNGMTEDLPSPIDEPDHTADEALALARDYITYKVEGTSPQAGTEAARTLRRVGDELIDRHQTVFNAMARRLQYSNPAQLEQYAHLSINQRKFMLIASEITKEGQENWGRVVSLFVLGALLALNDTVEEGGRDMENIITFVGSYIGTQKKGWIERNGGWAGFVKFFDNGASEDKKVWKGLLYAGLGLGAIASLAASRQ